MNSLLAYASENSGGSSSISGIWGIVAIVGMWKMFEKAGEPGWKAIIPFYNEYILCDKVMKNPWYWLRLFVVIIPLIGWIAFFYFQYQIGKATAKAYGQPESWAWGYTFVSPIFYCITGFGQYQYFGPFGVGDRRTGEARQAKTVDFDVVRDEPVAAKVEPEVKINQVDEGVVVNEVRDVDFDTAANESAEVEFEFSQDEAGE